jgi:hypothetical protein
MPLCAIEASASDERKGGCPDAHTLGFSFVMAGLVPAIHVFVSHQRKTWMPATSAGMTSKLGLGDRRNGQRSMKKPTVKYSKGEIGRVRIVEDFLPSPDRLTMLTDQQLEEVRRRRADPNGRRLTLDEFKERLRRRLDE